MKRNRWLLTGPVLAFAVIWTALSAGVPSLASPAAPQSLITYTLYLPTVMVPPGYDWPQFDFDPQHSGNNTLETRISTTNVVSLSLLFKKPLPSNADGAPAYLSSVATYTGTRDLVFVTTTDGHIAALDAHTGTPIWSKVHGPGTCHINGTPNVCYTTSSPAIDPNRGYVYSYGLDGAVHKHAVGDGSEVLGSGWPETTTLKAYDEKGSSALSLAIANNGTAYLYLANGGYPGIGGYPGDSGDYQGHVTAINLSNGAQSVFNMLCSNHAVHFVDSRTTAGTDCYPQTQSAVWARPGVVYNANNDRIYMATGNGTFDPSRYFWGDSVVELNPDASGLSGKPLDSYTATDFQFLQDNDLDQGSTAPALLPPAGGKYPHLAVQGGKDGILRLLNLDNLSGQGAVGFTGGQVSALYFPPGGQILTQPAVWTNPADRSIWIYVANGNGLSGFRLSIDGSGNPSLQWQWTQGSGTSPIIANGVLYIARPHVISARNPLDGSLLWSDNNIGGIHWASPIVANGVVYISDKSSNLNAYALQ
jgi:PQQ-like domain